MTLRRITAVLACSALGTAACSGHTARPVVQSHPPFTLPTTGPTVVTTPPTTGPTPPPPPKSVQVKVAGVAALAPFPSCGALLDSVRAEATSEVTAWGLAPPAMYGNMGMAPMATDGRAAASAAAPSSAGAAGSTGSAGSPSSPASFSTTNNQEAGVDEPDLAKTDGHLMVVLRNANVVQVLDVGTGPQSNRGALMLPQATATGLFLVGSDVVVLGRSQTSYPTPMDGGASARPAGGPDMPMYPGSADTIVWVISLANPDRPVITRSFTVSGSEVDARLIGHSVKLVVQSQPRMAFPQPKSSSPADMAQAVATNQAIIAKAPVGDWVPSVTDPKGVTRTADCGTVNHAPDRYGVGMVSVVTLDPEKSQPLGMVSILGNPGVVYASPTNLYVASSSFAVQRAMATGSPMADEKTVIHDFSIAEPTRATYVGSGTVPGVVLNQFSMSEFNGNLRVATTTGIPSPPPMEGGPVPAADGSQSQVTVMHAAAGSLVTIGQVGGLGRTQKIYGVRFVGPLGYVVTFRQMDPLYVVDLSVPALPIVRGALELTGYSAYLNSVGDGLLLGVGVASDSQGRPGGMQVSLFDVRDPAHPKLAGQDVITNAQAQVGNDPHAFLWWAPTRTVVLPGQAWSDQSSFVGAYAFHVDPATGITKIGQLTHSSRNGTGTPMIERAIVVGDHLYTISDAGVLSSDLHTLADQAWTAF